MSVGGTDTPRAALATLSPARTRTQPLTSTFNALPVYRHATATDTAVWVCVCSSHSILAPRALHHSSAPSGKHTRSHPHDPTGLINFHFAYSTLRNFFETRHFYQFFFKHYNIEIEGKNPFQWENSWFHKSFIPDTWNWLWHNFIS